MAKTDMLMVFSYDVHKDSVRRKVADVLSGVLSRVQMSVFEGRITEAAAQQLGLQVLALMDESDSLRVYAVTAIGMKHSFAHGGAPLAENHDFWLV